MWGLRVTSAVRVDVLDNNRGRRPVAARIRSGSFLPTLTRLSISPASRMSSFLVRNISGLPLKLLGNTLRPSSVIDLLNNNSDRLDELNITEACREGGEIQKLISANKIVVLKVVMATFNPDVGAIAIASAPDVTLDFNANNVGYFRLALGNDANFRTVNLASGRELCVRIDAGGFDRALTFPAGWKFLGAAAPTSLTAGKSAMLSLVAFGDEDTDVLAGYSAEP